MLYSARIVASRQADQPLSEVRAPPAKGSCFHLHALIDQDFGSISLFRGEWLFKIQHSSLGCERCVLYNLIFDTSSSHMGLLKNTQL